MVRGNSVNVHCGTDQASLLQADKLAAPQFDNFDSQPIGSLPELETTFDGLRSDMDELMSSLVGDHHPASFASQGFSAGLQEFPPVGAASMQSVDMNEDSDNTEVQIGDEAVPKEPDNETSLLSNLSPYVGPSEHPVPTRLGIHSSFTDYPLKPKQVIVKQVPALSLGVPLTDFGSVKGQGKESRRTRATGKKDDEDKRIQHNEMMRQNRERANQKFEELIKILETCPDPRFKDKPMRNKIQILERVMLEYTAMEAKKVYLKTQLLLAPQDYSQTPRECLAVMSSASSLSAACDIIVRITFGSMNWKYGEIYWKKSSPSLLYEYELVNATVSPQNTLETRHQLSRFAKLGQKNHTDPLLRQVAKLGSSRWIPDLGKITSRSSRWTDARECGISTTLLTPVNSSRGSEPDAIIALYHADDELVSFSGRIRPYDSSCVSKVQDLVDAACNSSHFAE